MTKQAHGLTRSRRLFRDASLMWFRLLLSSAAIIASVLIAAVPYADAAVPLYAQTRTTPEVSFSYFTDRLSLFGRCVQHPKWGAVWQPAAGPTFRPYFYGYWQYTPDYGWLWASNEPYGDIVYHYGRWIFDPDAGWLWVPGYVWGPSWVVWRQRDGEAGWLPMPPGYADFDTEAGSEPRASDDAYGYRTLYGDDFASDPYVTMWTFAQHEDFGRSDRRHYVTDPEKLRDFLQHSEDRTAYRIDRDRVVDRFLESSLIPSEAPRNIDMNAAARALRGVPMASVSEGREIFQRERDRMSEESCAPLKTPEPPAPEGEAARRALSSLPPHGATPLRPFYPGLYPLAPLAEPLREIQRRSRTVGTDPHNLNVPPALLAPSLGPTPPLSEPLRAIDRFSRTIGIPH